VKQRVTFRITLICFRITLAICVYTQLKILCQDFVFDHNFLRVYEYNQNGHEKPNKGPIGHEREVDWV
jgi:hypothetical protein